MSLGTQPCEQSGPAIYELFPITRFRDDNGWFVSQLALIPYSQTKMNDRMGIFVQSDGILQVIGGYFQ